MEWYDNVFDILDRNNDVLEYTKEELNRYFTSGHLNVTIDEEAAEQEEEDDIIDDDNLFLHNYVESTGEQVLSQQFSQLSTENESEEGGSSVVSSKRKLNTTSAPYGVFKRIKSANDNDPNVTEGEEEEQDQIPAYLLTTNKSFDHMIQKVMNTASSIDMNDLRQLALLIHHIAAVNIKRQVTIVYLRSGIGKLRESEPSLTEVIFTEIFYCSY
ncbi:unnamed protein product [Adineta steineri]|uniref:Uncharacterized protein n=1 Tax=Adineta steineri TaxID=433720 RepID=A0A815EU89_9BILA|nr:unnamed protein product [Adineta steineri]